jgi:hypothetical protein
LSWDRANCLGGSCTITYELSYLIESDNVLESSRSINNLISGIKGTSYIHEDLKSGETYRWWVGVTLTKYGGMGRGESKRSSSYVSVTIP